MLDPTALATGIVVVLGKYTIDQGAKLLKEAGPKAAETAKQLYQTTLDYFRQKNRVPELEKLEKNPDDPKTQGRVEVQLEDAVQEDEALRAKLEGLLAEFQKEANAYAQTQGPATDITVGSGAAAVGDGSRAYGQGSVHVEGSSTGNIVTGSGNTVSYGASSGAQEDLADPSLKELAPVPRGLRAKMVKYLGSDELKDVVFDLELNYEAMKEQNQNEFVKKLIIYCRQQKRVDDLLEACRTANETVNWDE